MKNFISFSGFNQENNNLEKNQLSTLINSLNLDGTEVYIAALIPREKPLFKSENDRKKLIKTLQSSLTKKIHLSYWAEPTDFLENVDKKGLMGRFKNKNNIKSYFSDLNGEHIYNRWTQEYSIAKNIDAESVTFHAIDYFHIDGMWKFTNSKPTILKALASIIEKLLIKLDKENLLKDGPYIELENSGFGLEYGAQTAEDFSFLFNQIEDKYHKLKIGWDTNHLLHAIGFDQKTKLAKFFIPNDEKTSKMERLENKYAKNYNLLCSAWLKENILDLKTIDKVGSIHLSDAPKKVENIFIKGKMVGKFFETLQKMKSSEEKENYGASVVAKYYDAHLPFKKDKYDLTTILNRLKEKTNFSILHELKNNELNKKLLNNQMKVIL